MTHARDSSRFQRIVRRWSRWKTASQAPERAYAETWEQIRTLAASGTFWPERAGTLPPSIDGLPLTRYADYAAALEASFHTTVSPFTGEAIIRWVKSSGSSGTLKRFPFTRSHMDAFFDAAEFTLPLSTFLARARGRNGTQLHIRGELSAETSPAGIPVGFGSTFDTEPEPGYPPEANRDPESIARFRPLYAMCGDHRGILSITAEPLFQMLDRIDADRHAYAKWIRGDALPPPLPELEITPERRRYLLDRLDSSQALALHDIWPNLAFVQTWRGGGAGIGARALQRSTTDSVKFVDYHYNATEGAIANIVDPEAIGGPLFAGGHLHEFIEVGTDKQPAHLKKPWELEPGRDYHLFLTTQMGFIRYDLGDIVRCTGFFHRVPTLRFERRSARELAMGVVTLHEAQLARAVDRVLPDYRVRRVVAPTADGRGLVLYTDHEPQGPDLSSALHRELVDVSEAYATFVASGTTGRAQHRLLAASHPVWTRTAPAHDQAKPQLLLLQPIAEVTGP